MTTVVPTAATAPAAPAATPSTASIRTAGVVLAVCSLPWAVTAMVAGLDVGYPTHVVCGIFQVGIWALLATLWRTRATGTTTLARAVLVIEAGMLGLATAASVLMLMGEPIASSTPTAVLDVFWPLSMLGMAVIGIKVAITGRWRGVLRAWPVVAETWALVVLPSLALFGPGVAAWVCGLHLILGYFTLGALIAIRPDLTR